MDEASFISEFQLGLWMEQFAVGGELRQAKLHFQHLYSALQHYIINLCYRKGAQFTDNADVVTTKESTECLCRCAYIATLIHLYFDSHRSPMACSCVINKGSA